MCISNSLNVYDLYYLGGHGNKQQDVVLYTFKVFLFPVTSHTMPTLLAIL